MKLKSLAIGLMTATMWTSVAYADPITTLIFGATFAASFFGGLVSIGISSAITYGLSELVSVIFPPTSTASTNTSTPTQVTYGDRVNRGASFGSILDAGEWTYVNEYNDAKQLQLVFVLDDGWCAGLEHTVFVDGTQYNLVVNATLASNCVERYTVDTYGSDIDVRYHDGRPGQATDTELITQGLDGNAKFTNMAYVAVTVTSDSAKFNGPPSFGWVYKGLKAYDPRLDTTTGGSGPQRLNDPTTWVYTKNPAVLANHYMRGFYANGVLVLGPGLLANDIDFNAAVTAMNICDEVVVRPDGTLRARYEINYKFDESMQYSDVLTTLCQAMGGFYGELQGRIGLFAGKAQASVLTFTDKDLVKDADRTFDPLKQGIVLYTGIEGTYTSLSDFNVLAYSSIISSDFATEDNDIRIWSQDFLQVQDAHQAYLLAKQQLFANRFQAVASVVLDIKDLLVTVGDWVVWNSANALRGERTYRVVQSAHNLAKMQMTLTLQEVDDSIWDDDATTVDIEVPTRVYVPSGYLSDVAGWDVDAVSLNGASGEVIPALQFTYTTISDPAVRAIDIEYRIADTGSGVGPTIKVTDPTIQDGIFTTTQGVQPGFTYEARAILDSIPGRTVNYTAWKSAVVPTPALVASGTGVGIGAVNFPQLALELSNTIGVLTGPVTDEDSLAAMLQDFQDHMDDLATALITNTAVTQAQKTLLQASFANATAAVIHAMSVSASADSALAADIVEVVASLGTAFADGLFKIDVATAMDSSYAEVLMKAAANLSSTFSVAAFRLKALVDGMGGSNATIEMMADNLYFMDTSGTIISAPFSIESGVVKLGATRAHRITSSDVVSMYIDWDNPEIFMSG